MHVNNGDFSLELPMSQDVEGSPQKIWLAE